MKWPRKFGSLIPIALAAGIGVASITAIGLPEALPNYALTAGGQLIGGDEFNGWYGTAPNPQFWTYDVGAGGWGNNELQTYTSSRLNSKLDGKGNLVISALRSFNGYTSARLVTRGKVDFGFGLVEARIKIPADVGLLPAFWMLGTDIGSVGWPACGEIDGMEMLADGTVYHTAVHGPTTVHPGVWKQSTDGRLGGVDLSKDFHNYGIYREPGLVRVLIDGIEVGTYRRSEMPAGASWAFDGPMYLNLNIAVGGNWPGSPNGSTRFPANMLVDWVRYST